jgi:glutathione S-transferase
MDQTTLYSGTKNASSWAMRAWLALREADVEFEEEVIDIRRPQRFANLAVVGRFSPPAMVPTLVIGDRVIFDSVAIMEYANDVSGGKLLPSDAVARGQARSIVAWQHSGLSNICARISFESAFYPVKRGLSPTEQGECKRLFDWLEQLITASRGPYLFGAAVALADFALVPAVVRLTRHDLNLGSWPGSASWADTILRHPLVREWMDVADQLPHVWLDDYLLPSEGS